MERLDFHRGIRPKCHADGGEGAEDHVAPTGGDLVDPRWIGRALEDGWMAEMDGFYFARRH